MTWRQILQAMFALLQPWVPTYALLDRMFAWFPHYRKAAADAAANTNTTAECFFRAPAAGEVMEAYFTPDSTLTAHDTTYATISLLSGAGTALPATVVGTIVTKITGGSGDFVAGTPVAFTLTAANTLLAAGGTLGVSIDKASTGVAVPPGVVSVRVAQR